MKEEKISVIIPAYNAEKYIKKCLYSLLNQTYKNLEIIVVNDGSQDNTAKIVEQVQKEDSRIILINKTNSGVSETRNIGLKNATGKYIGFSDADDYLEKTMYEKLILSMEETNSDIAMCSYNIYNQGIKSQVLFPWEEQTKVFPSKEIAEKLLPLYIAKLKNEQASIWGTVWRMLFKSEIIKNLKFEPKIKIAEDLLFIIDSFEKSNQVCAINECLYNYIVYQTSAIGRYKDDLNKTNELFHSKLIKKLKKLNFFEKNKIRYQLNRNSMYTTSISNEVKNDRNNIFQKNVQIKSIINRFNKDSYIDRNIIKELDLSRKLVFYLMKIKASMILTILFILKEKSRKGRK